MNPYTGKDIEFVPGTRPIYPADKVIAGYKCKHSNPIKYAEEIMDKYGIEGDPKKLSKQKAYYEAYDDEGQMNFVELHFYMHPVHNGGFGYKVKPREGDVFLD